MSPSLFQIYKVNKTMTKPKQDVRLTLINIIKEQAILEEDEFVNAISFKDIMDSLTLLEIVCQIEEEFDIEIDDKQIPEIKSFDEAVKVVTQML